MSNPSKNPTPQETTKAWRKVPKSPNFLGIVLASMAVLLVLFVAAWFLLRADGAKMLPHGPNPQPNSLVQPLKVRSIDDAATRVV